MSSVVILTPLKIEYSALMTALAQHSACPRGDWANQLGVHVAVGGHGKVAMALSAQELILKFHPEVLVLAGAAGALSGALNPGDVVLGTASVEHDFRLRFIQDRPLPRFPASDSLVQELSASAPFAVHHGAIASGDEDIVDGKRAAEIADATHALAVAWEGIGAARASQRHKVPWVEIRAITDMANEDAVDAFATHLRFGMNQIAALLMPWLITRAKGAQ